MNCSFKPVITFPRLIVPKITNKTGGHTPYVNLVKRKLDHETNKNIDDSNQNNYETNQNKILKVGRYVRKGKMMTYATTSSQNKLFSDILLDGVICAYTAKCHTSGPPGYLKPAL